MKIFTNGLEVYRHSLQLHSPKPQAVQIIYKPKGPIQTELNTKVNGPPWIQILTLSSISIGPFRMDPFK